MRIKKGEIVFRNEFNLLNPKELFSWLFGSDYLCGYNFKCYGISMESNFDYRKLNREQINKVKKFFIEYSNKLPVGLIDNFNYFIDIDIPEDAQQKGDKQDG